MLYPVRERPVSMTAGAAAGGLEQYCRRPVWMKVLMSMILLAGSVMLRQ